MMELNSKDHWASARQPTPTDRAALLRSLSIPSGPAPRRRRNRTAIGLGIVAGLQAVVLAVMFERSAAPAAVPAAGPTAATASNAAAPPPAGAKLDAEGFVTASRVATVSSRSLGIITSIRVQEGDRVVRGQILGTLDSTNAQLERDAASAQLQSANARLRGARAVLLEAIRTLNREEQLMSRGFSTRARVDAARTARDAATSTVDSAGADVLLDKVQVARLRSLLDDYVIRAPFDGVVTARNAQPGEVLAPSGAGGGFTRTGLCTIVDTSSLEIIVDVNEQMITRVRIGQPVRAQLYAHKDLVIPAKVVQVLPSADRAKATVRVRIALLSRDVRILPEMGVRVAFL